MELTGKVDAAAGAAPFGAGADAACCGGAIRVARRKHRFNLLELLIVIVILAILLALLAPGMTESRRRAQRTICQGQFRQYTLALTLYGNEHDDYFPTPDPAEGTALRSEFRAFWKLLAPYLPLAGPYYWDDNQVAHNESNANCAIPSRILCPSAVGSFDSSVTQVAEADLYIARPSRAGVYETALILYDSHPEAEAEMAGGRRMAQLPSPSRYFFMNDAGFNDGTDDRQYPYWKAEGFLSGHYPWGHGRYYNAAFLDGHAEGRSRKRRDIRWQALYSRVL